jgi:hypothetical protein
MNNGIIRFYSKFSAKDNDLPDFVNNRGNYLHGINPELSQSMDFIPGLL